MPGHNSAIDEAVMEVVKRSLPESILDIGCGWGYWGISLSGVLYHLTGHRPRLTGLDLWPPYLRFLAGTAVYRDLILATGDKLPFKESTFDCVVASEVLEHMPKKEGLRLIQECERVSHSLVILTTPNGILPQGECYENPFEKHISAWSRSDFARLGYIVEMVGGPRLVPRGIRIVGYLANTFAELLPRRFLRIPRDYMVAWRLK